jgi:hypothetical protein
LAKPFGQTLGKNLLNNDTTMISHKRRLKRDPIPPAAIANSSTNHYPHCQSGGFSTRIYALKLKEVVEIGRCQNEIQGIVPNPKPLCQRIDVQSKSLLKPLPRMGWSALTEAMLANRPSKLTR